MDAVLAHLKAEHYVAFSNKSAELRQGQPSVNLYDASPINLNR
jgi:quinol monooxygenase YgiN